MRGCGDVAVRCCACAVLCCRGRGQGGGRAGGGAAYIRISDFEIADDYPMPLQYKVGYKLIASQHHGFTPTLYSGSARSWATGIERGVVACTTCGWCFETHVCRRGVRVGTRSEVKMQAL